MRLPLLTVLPATNLLDDVEFASLRQANWLFNDVTIKQALSHSRRQDYAKHFLIPDDEVIALVQIQFLDIACFLLRCRTKVQRQNEMNKKIR